MTPPRRRLAPFVLALTPLLAAAGCAPRTGIAYVEIENDQGTMGGGRAEPIWIDPRVEVVRNEYSRSQVNNGSNIRQRTVIRGPVMIVPAMVPATQPAQPR